MAFALLLLSVLLLHLSGAAAERLLNFDGVPNNEASASNNTVALNAALASLLPGDTLLIGNETFWLAGGVRAAGLVNATLRLDGTLRFLGGRKGWPVETYKNKTRVQKAILLADATGLTLTSSGAGTVDGSGESWWGYVQYLIHGEDRPKLFTIQNATDVLVERWHFRQSAYHTFHADDVARLEVRYCSVDNRANAQDRHGVENLRALNTDGFDVSGRDIHIHDSTVWNQDDCFTIVPTTGDGINAKCTENVLVEDVNASGLGLTIGSIEPTRNHACIRNVTFRRAKLHHTFKGIYIKSGNRANPDPNATAEITNILYEDIVMEEPESVPIWIGPAQEADSANACSLAWPVVPFAKCPPPLATVAWTNVTLRNIRVLNSKTSPGVIFGNGSNPIQGLVFDGVRFVNPPDDGTFGKDYFFCEGAGDATAIGDTWPVPTCFADKTEPALNSSSQK